MDLFDKLLELKIQYSDAIVNYEEVMKKFIYEDDYRDEINKAYNTLINIEKQIKNIEKKIYSKIYIKSF
jgi:hypothetical protein